MNCENRLLTRFEWSDDACDRDHRYELLPDGAKLTPVMELDRLSLRTDCSHTPSYCHFRPLADWEHFHRNRKGRRGR